MPSSLVFTALVVSWLAVLVPVVARRRQLVPRPAEADLCSRVLVRTDRAPAVKEVDVSHQVSQGRNGSGVGGTAVADRSPAAVPAARAERERELDDDLAEGYDDEFDDLDDDLDGDRAHDDRAHDDGSDRAEPKPFRPGRGGFDADAARAAAEARYATRRRIAVGLIALAAVSGLVALVLTSAAWWVFGLAVLGLTGYLVFLRRQTRLEEELRERRIARLHGDRREIEARRRAERDAHRGHPDDLADDGFDDEFDDDDLDEELDGGLDDAGDRRDDTGAPADDATRIGAVAATRWAAPRTPAPPVPAGLELVGDSEEDPAFHDLAADRLPAYRRAAGA